MTDETCGICARNADRSDAMGKILWEDEHWLLRHNRPPYGVAGWSMLYAKRHVAGIAQFDDDEAGQLGPLLRAAESVLLETTGALRIYTAAMGEMSPHFHAHLVPRYPQTPGGVRSWALYGLLDRARAGEFTVSQDEVDRICGEVSAVLPGRIPF